jgi:hypothetical protein
VKVHEVLAVLTHPAGAETDGEEVTVYPVIAEPPFEDGAVQEMLACVYPAVAVTLVGAPGTLTA